MLTIRSASNQATNTMEVMEHRAVYKPPESATVDVEVTIVQGSEIRDSHTVIGTIHKSSYSVKLELDDIKEETSESKTKKGQHDWGESFILTANRSSRLSLKLYCKHANVRSDHVIGEAVYDFWNIPRHQNVQIDLHDPLKSRVSAKITLCLKVAATVTFSVGPPALDLQSLYSLNQMTKIVESLSSEDCNKLSPAWVRFIHSLDIVVSNARKISELHPPVQVALGAVAFAFKAVLDGVARDERIDKLVGVMGDLHAYIADSCSIEKIASYKDTLRTVLVQTTECSYFIGDYRKVADFAQRVVVNLVSNVDVMIQKFENTFRDLKIELILGSSLQTTIVAFRILQKVENIETMLYIEKLKPLKRVGWALSRTCLRGTRNVIINDLVQWASNSAGSGTSKQSRICVLQGPPDCGKSSIAHSVAEVFHLQNRLGAAIFLDSRTEGKSIGSQILSTTIASQLASYDPRIGAAIAAKIKEDASLSDADIARQFPHLIVSATEGLSLIGPICIIIDGLQKIGNHTDQLRLLTTIGDHFIKLPSNFRLILTARLGRMSEDIARHLPDRIIKGIAFDDEGTVIDYKKHVSESLRRLLFKKSKLADKYTVDDLRDQFIKRSKGIYFWVSMLRQFLLLCSDGDECTILENILSTNAPLTKEEAIDQLFCVILSYNPLIPLMCETLIRSLKPLPLQDLPPKVSVTVSEAESTYQSPILNMMESLKLVIETGRDRTGNPLFSIHPSLEDFLTSSRRCHGTDFYVDRLVPSLTMVNICFDSMARWLRQNICGLDDTMALNEEIPDRDGRVSQCIPVVLQHACRNWMFHLDALDNGNQVTIDSALERLDTFLSKHLLPWIECMSLLGWLNLIPTYLRRLSSWLTKCDIPLNDDRLILTMEAIHFIHAFSPLISKAAMQTYYSALPLMPSDSLLSQKYISMSRPSLKLSGSRYLQIFHNPPVSLPIERKEVRDSTGFGDVMVVSLSKGGIGFFDISSGNEIGSRIPTAEYSMISSSPDGRRIVTCHEDQRALDIWNVRARAHAKAIAKELEHRKIKRIAFSVDGKKVMIVTSPNHRSSRRSRSSSRSIHRYRPPRILHHPSRRYYPGSTSSMSTYQSSNTSLSYSNSPPSSPSTYVSRSPSPREPPLLPSRSLSRYPPPVVHRPPPPLPNPPLPNPPLSPHQLVFIWDIKTDKLLKQLEVARTAHKVAISDASQMVVADKIGIKIIDVGSGPPIGQTITPSDDSPSAYDSTRLIWSSNGQTPASASVTPVRTRSNRRHSFGTTQNIIDLACSPDSSKVVAILGDSAKRSYRTDEYKEREMTLSVWCMRSGSLFGSTTFKLATRKAAISFAADGRDILICCYDLDKQTSNRYSPVPSPRRQPNLPKNAILLRFSVIPTYLETYMHRPLKFHPSQTPHTIEYSHYISGAINDIDYASHVDADGWIHNTKGEREIWTPWANYEVLCSRKPPPKRGTEYRTLEVRDPDTKTVVLIYVITFGQYRSKPLPVPPGSS